MPREILKATRKGQVTIPKEYRDALNIKEGDVVCASLEGDKIVLMKLGAPEPGDPVREEEYERLVKLLEEERKAWR
jgi:AbrB family looped-hinge helix DNA binding protein